MSFCKRIRRALKAYHFGKAYGMGRKRLRRAVWEHFWK